MFSCPNCGGNVRFDIPSQKLSCEYCRGKFSPYDFESKTGDAEETVSSDGNFDVTVFTCPQCGGELLGTDNAAAAFCSFCGASTILYSRISHRRRPNYIITFQKTKEDCRQAYSALIKKAIFAPKELKDPQYIDSFRGIYMPYWAFYITQKGPVDIPATKEYRRGDYVITDHYRLQGELDCYYKGLSYDASSSFADSISEELAPYDLKGMQPFTPAYLSGFYADTADVAPSVYQPEAELTACSETAARLGGIPQYSDCRPAGELTPELLHTKTAQVDSTMFPVWFMSYQNRDRVAYVTVNGQTGKIAADLPIDPKKYALSSLLLAVPLFVVFSLFLTLLPSRLLALSAVLALVTSAIGAAELSAISRKATFTEDRGMLYRNDRQKLEELNRKRKSAAVKPKPARSVGALVGLIMTVYFLAITGMVVLPLISRAISFDFTIMIWIVLLIGMITVFFVGYGKASRTPESPGMAGSICGCIAVALGAGITLLNPVSDLWYYGGTAAGLAAVILTVRDVIRCYNVLSTRRLPQFDRQGGDDNA